MGTLLQKLNRMRIKHLGLLAAAVMITAACRMPVVEEQGSLGQDRPVVFETADGLTRTAFTEPEGDSYPVVWQEGDQVKLLLNGEEVNASTDRGVLTARLSDGGRRAFFSASLPSEQGSVRFDVLSPASAFVEADVHSGRVSLTVPASQSPSSLSADPAAMLLGASAGPFDDVPSQVQLSFRHLTAYGKLSLTNLKGDLTAVELISDRDLAGTFGWTPQAGTLEAVSAVRTIRIAATDPGAVWFACIPSDWSGSSLKVVATTSAGTFEKTVSFPSGRDLKAGHIARFTVDMSDASGKSDVFDENRIVFSFGAISDTHVSGTNNDSGNKFSSALRQLKERASVKDEDGLDAVVVAGDLTDHPRKAEDETGYFKSLYESAFNPSHVPMIYTIGNHDVNPSYAWTANTVAQAKQMSQVLGPDYFLVDQDQQMRENFECRDCLVDGYHVLCITPNSCQPIGFYGNVLVWLDAKLKELTEADPERFVFVNTHPMIENTVYGSLLGSPAGVAISDIWYSSAADYWATRALTETLAKYPQAVTFSGHLHFPLHDPRSIWQGAFTSFGCGSVYYMAIENGKYEDRRSDTVMNDSYSVSDGWLIQLDANGNMRATAMDFTNQSPIGTPYEIPYPHADKSHLTRYDSNRALVNQAPVLDASSLQMTTRQVGTLTSAIVSWTKAMDDEFAHHYVLTVKKGGATIASKKYLADFYRHPQPSGMKDTWSVSLGSLAAGTYEVTLTAYDSWDAFATVTKSCTIDGPQPMQKGLYADIDFDGGTVRDSKGKLTVTNKGATIAQTSVTHAGKTYSVPAMQAGASKYVECQFNEISSFEMARAFMSEGFSIEAFFVDRAPGKAIHGVFCGTQAGGWGLAMTGGENGPYPPYFVVGENRDNSYVYLYASSSVSTSELTHVVCVYDPSTKKASIYFNGQLNNTQTITGQFYPGAIPTYNRFCLGADISLTTTPDFQCTDMIITDAKWYVGALDAAAVQAAYTAAVNALNQ